MSSVIHVVNPGDRSWTRHRYVLWFGAYGTTRLMVWANDFDSALEECAEWLAEHAPGHVMLHGSDEHMELYRDACEELGISPDATGLCDETVWATAEADLTYTEAGFLTSYEWGICLEDPTRAQLMQFARDIGAEFRHE